jgi:hypothetical protein
MWYLALLIIFFYLVVAMTVSVGLFLGYPHSGPRRKSSKPEKVDLPVAKWIN